MLRAASFTSVTSPVLRLFQTDASQVNTNADSSFSDIVLPEKEVILFGQIVSGWKIIQPLTITIEQFNDLFIANEDVFGVYGDGDTEFEALEDYKSSLIDYYQLFEHRAQDDKEDQLLFNHLKLYISSTE